MRSSGLVSSFLNGIADAIEALSRDYNPSFFNPSLGILVAVLTTGIVSFSSCITVPLTALALSALLVAVLSRRFTEWARPVLFALFIATFVSAPLPCITPGDPLITLSLGRASVQITLSGVRDAALLILRTVGAAAMFTAIVMHLGWQGLVRGLRGLRIPRELALMVGFFVKYAPMFLRDACRMIAAREARLISRRRYYIAAWVGLTSVIGEIVLRSYWRASMVSMAMKARSFGYLEHGRKEEARWGKNDLSLMAVLALIAAAALPGWW